MQVSDKCQYFFLKGWLLNIVNHYDKNSYDLLTKAVKLKPDFDEAWLEIGECYFKKGDLKSSLNSFENVLKHDPTNKKALRNSSIIMRSLPCDQKTKKANLLKSVEIAKQAVECDLNDAESWAVLGNAYLTLLFVTKESSESLLMKSCKSAYQKALADEVVKTKSDVLYNYSLLMQHEENFESTLNLLHQAHQYEPSWQELEQRKLQLITIFSDICYKSTSSLIKSNKLNAILKKLNSTQNKLRTKSSDTFQCRLLKFSDLIEGVNEGKMAIHITSYLTDSDNIFLCSIYYGIDGEGKTVVLFIHDLLKSKGLKLGDIVVVNMPCMRSHHIKYENKEFIFDCIKIAHPAQDLLVNGRHLSEDMLSLALVNVTLKSD